MSWQVGVGVLIWACMLSSLVVVSLQYFGTDCAFDVLNPGIGHAILFLGILVYACYDCRGAARSDAAWNWIAVAWFFVFMNVVHGIVTAFSTISTEDVTKLSQLLQENFYLAIVSAIILPLFCTGLAIMILAPDVQALSTGMTRWIYLSLAVTILDIALCFTLASMTFGTWGR